MSEIKDKGHGCGVDKHGILSGHVMRIWQMN
jgi:hypothetical protein